MFSIVASVLAFLTNGKETRIFNRNSQSSSLLLSCTSSNPTKSFFTSLKVTTEEHEVKYFFENNKISEVSYSYVGNFSSKKEAESELSLMNFEYNTYIGKTQIYQEDLTPVFMVLDTNATINLFFTKNKFTAETAPLIFLEQESFNKIGKASAEEIKSIYEALGFSCNLNK